MPAENKKYIPDIRVNLFLAVAGSIAVLTYKNEITFIAAFAVSIVFTSKRIQKGIHLCFNFFAALFVFSPYGRNNKTSNLMAIRSRYKASFNPAFSCVGNFG